MSHFQILEGVGAVDAISELGRRCEAIVKNLVEAASTRGDEAEVWALCQLLADDNSGSGQSVCNSRLG